ncbi:hypothetical protein OPQ81_000296 [Rhizoctonia solani]|nr:hypothetical protein OPQ81_000296 [Rhizoctonia solani]
MLHPSKFPTVFVLLECARTILHSSPSCLHGQLITYSVLRAGSFDLVDLLFGRRSPELELFSTCTAYRVNLIIITAACCSLMPDIEQDGENSILLVSGSKQDAASLSLY